ncbi:hypothetical protein B0H10DRAFT_2037633 [Mycena sp. CBHHK59/15]|nr:hypothetical protein B0H10DRAFT_2037633 [Mycena sp. CBHHK59/15]
MSTPHFGFHTTAEDVAARFSPEMEGKNVLVTGTSLNGIGWETARVIAKYANLVIITGYNADRLKLTEDAIKKSVPSANLRLLNLDLSSLAAVRKAAAEVNAYPEPLHAAITLTVDNLENQMATDHFGRSSSQAPRAQAPRHGYTHYTPRVVYVSSASHAFGNGVDFSTLAKSATISTAIELSKRSGGRMNAYSLHRESSMEEMKQFGLLNEDGSPSDKLFQWKTIPEGAATTLVAAFDPGLNDKPGMYLDDCKEAVIAAHTSNPDICAKLWTATEEIVGEKFEF